MILEKENNMALPMASTPRYKLTIPSSKKSVTYRPFLVKEEKALMIAQQSEDHETMLTTLKSVIESCVEDIKVSDLAIFDIEYIFTQLRAKSVGENVDLILKCDTCTDEKASVRYTIDLTKLKVDFPEDHQKTIPLFDDVGVIMQYPSLDLLKKIEGMDNTDIGAVFDIICSCIESVYNTDEMFQTKDQAPEEVREFVNNLTQEQFVKLQRFFETMPKLEERVKYSCPLCKKEHEKFIKGLESFF
jgi:hypothetical protein